MFSWLKTQLQQHVDPEDYSNPFYTAAVDAIDSLAKFKQEKQDRAYAVQIARSSKYDDAKETGDHDSVVVLYFECEGRKGKGPRSKWKSSTSLAPVEDQDLGVSSQDHNSLQISPHILPPSSISAFNMLPSSSATIAA